MELTVGFGVGSGVGSGFIAVIFIGISYKEKTNVNVQEAFKEIQNSP